MSKTFSIACTSCKMHLWIAQRSSATGRTRLYGMTEHIDALRSFLDSHQGHPLIYDQNETGQIAEYFEVEPAE